jgi:Ulp1 family protease
MSFDSFAALELKSELKNFRNQQKTLGFVPRLNFTMTVEKIRSLFDRNWLSDEVINTYISIVVERAKGTNMAYLESYWCSQIVKHGPNGVSKWHQTADLLRRLHSGGIEYLFAPVHFDESHWALCLLAPRKKTWYILDSAGHVDAMKASEFAQIMQLWLDQNAGGPWVLEIPINLSNAHQDFRFDSYNCGVYICLYAEWLCAGRPLDYIVNTRVGTGGISQYRDAILMSLFRDIPLALDFEA